MTTNLKKNIDKENKQQSALITRLSNATYMSRGRRSTAYPHPTGTAGDRKCHVIRYRCVSVCPSFLIALQLSWTVVLSALFIVDGLYVGGLRVVGLQGADLHLSANLDCLTN